MLYEIAKPVVRTVLQVVWRPRIEGAGKLPRTGAVIVASNHLGIADTVVMPALVGRSVHFLAKAEMFSGGSLANRALGMLLRSLRVMPVERSGGSASQAAIETGLAILRKGQVLGIYPEGTRSPDGRLYRGKTGVARLALAVDCPIVPVGMVGTFEAHRGGRVIPRLSPRIQVRVGDPVRARDLVPGLAQLPEAQQYRAVTDALMGRIAALSGQEQVDRFAADAKRELAQRQTGPQQPST
ncbi:1-acyl-sn-glycerol-3-phosphate acyltransferase [Brachybacterium sp. EF45031]|uniref:lysophospholipid acyltransferase family protein n=1 Tax=Brachybacterium sillae TaxID=2810536 RepID=UPI00217E5F9E|nr:lysophospholipid acyltransferase family protein [Brachybacterium sillae]MCS6710492.1 1-acyl-sn-glycerol-3-phosphate acyltransferase [Brachybacterium sillae]